MAQILLAASLASSQPQVFDMNDRAEALLAAGDGAAAEAVLDKALVSAEQAFGAGHSVTAMIARNLALTCLRNGDRSRAERLARQSLSILETNHGVRDASVVPALNVLAEVLAASDQLSDARVLTERAVRVGPDTGPHYATAVHNLGAIAQRQGDLRSAKRYYRLAANECDRLLGSNHPY